MAQTSKSCNIHAWMIASMSFDQKSFMAEKEVESWKLSIVKLRRVLGTK